VSSLRPSRDYELVAFQKGYRAIAGVDEAGRGPLAGPVVAAACILPDDCSHINICDSKQLSPVERLKVYQQLLEMPGLVYGIGIIDAILIDKINILQATFEAMICAIAVMSRTPDYLLVDGNMLPRIDMAKEAVVKGDQKILSIAAASVLAKVFRDNLMGEFDKKWPNYGFAKHKGYGTRAHLEALSKWGPSPIHRMSFAPLKELIMS